MVERRGSNDEKLAGGKGLVSEADIWHLMR